MGEAMRGVVTADISNFQAGILKAKGLAKSFGISAESSLGVGAFKGMVAGALSIGAVTAGVQALLNKADGIDALAKRFDISAESIQSIQFAADQSGASSEAMFMGLKKLSIALEEAKGGDDEFIKSLKSMGVSLNDIKTKGAEAIFYQIGARINGTSKESVKLTDGIKVFGRAGDVVLGAMRDGFTQVAKEAKNLGTVISNIDVKKLADAHDNLEKTKAQITAKMATGAVSAIEGLGGIGKSVTKGSMIGYYSAVIASMIEGKDLNDSMVAAEVARQDLGDGEGVDRDAMLDSAKKRRLNKKNIPEVVNVVAPDFRVASFQSPNLSGNQSVGAFSGQNPFLERQIAIERQMLELQTKMEEHARKTAEATAKTANKPPDGTMD